MHQENVTILSYVITFFLYILHRFDILMGHPERIAVVLAYFSYTLYDPFASMLVRWRSYLGTLLKSIVG